MGGMHVHLRIIFADGTVWLARILRQNFTSFTDELSNKILLSECATLKWLETVGIPAPRLHGYGLRNDPHNDVGVAFMIIDELPGHSLHQTNMSEARLNKLYDQIADFYIVLSQHPFDRIGSLTMNSIGGIEMSAITGDRTGTLSQLGPYDDGKQYYASWAQEYLRLIADGQLFSRYSVNAYLIFKHLSQLAIGGKCNQFETGLDDGPFFLKHMDDKGDHIFVDEEFNITGLIDWSFARTVPIYEAFGPSLLTADMNEIYSGMNGLSGNDRLLAQALERKGSDLVRFAQSTDNVRRFTFGLGMGMDMSWNEAFELFNGILATFGDHPIVEWDKWRRHAISKWSNDHTLMALLEKSSNPDRQ